MQELVISKDYISPETSEVMQ